MEPYHKWIVTRVNEPNNHYFVNFKYFCIYGFIFIAVDQNPQNDLVTDYENKKEYFSHDIFLRKNDKKLALSEDRIGILYNHLEI